MPTLQQILSDEKQLKSIVSISAVYGLEHLRVFKETATQGVLILIASIIPNQKGLGVMLETSLAKALGCQVSVVLEQNIKASQKDSVLSHSIPISHLDDLKKLFNQPLNEIFLKPFIQDNSFLEKRRAKLADDFLNASNYRLSDFFAPFPQTPEDKVIRSSNKEEKSKKAELLEFLTSNNNDPHLVNKFLTELQPEVIRQMDIARHVVSSQELSNFQASQKTQ